MSDTDARWYDLGYALEKARETPSRSRLNGLVDRLMSFRGGSSDGDDDGEVSETSSDGGAMFDAVVGGGVTALSRQLLKAVPKRTDPTVMRVAKGAAAGAAATFARELSAPLLRGRLETPEIGDGLAERLASGAARGALFAAVIDPRLPGPVALRGAVYAAVEYLLAPNGGLGRMMGSAAPWRIIPGAESVVRKLESGEESVVDHLIFGLALALLLGDDA